MKEIALGADPESVDPVRSPGDGRDPAPDVGLGRDSPRGLCEPLDVGQRSALRPSGELRADDRDDRRD
jgi:hypothetical protein